MSSQQPGAMGIGAKRISTPYTFALKQLTPLLYFGLLAFMFVLLLMNGALQRAPMFLVVLCVMAALGYVWWKTQVQNLVDEVNDCGNYLLVKKGNEEDTVLLSNIINVNFSTARDGAQGRITLTLDTPGKFGTEITFAPPPHIYMSIPRRSEIAEDLSARAYNARSNPAV